jgi:hypothetical protein
MRAMDLPAVLLLALAGACSPYSTDLPAALELAQVQGTYRICALRFAPVQRALPEADVLARVMDGVPVPTLTLLGTAPEFELAYARRGEAAVQRLRGDVELGAGSVFLYPSSQTASLAALETLLPPAHLDLVFHPATRRLTAGSEVSAYWVRRQDYARAAGITAEGLQERISGHITAELAEGSCEASGASGVSSAGSRSPMAHRPAGLPAQ